MKNLKENKGKRIMAAALAVLVFFLFVAPHQLSAGKNPCRAALIECTIDAGTSAVAAGIAGFAGGLAAGVAAVFTGAAAGIAVGAALMSGCIMGYDFCSRYVKI
jgi:hypothetical protein